MSTSEGADTGAAFCATIVDEWVRSGVTDAVVSPGSRSTPLLVALAAEARLRVHRVLDERSAGFTALGIGLASGRPAPVVTTSGTAAVELHPAVVEAHQAGVALIAVTADRPPELHHVGAPQTVEQDGLFAGVTRWSVAPGVPDRASVGSWRSLASRAVAVAMGAGGGRPGPVHLNLAFREPLLGDPVDQPAGRPDGRPWHEVPVGPGRSPEPALVDLLAGCAGRAGRADRADRAGRAGGRGLLVAGAGCGDTVAVAAMADRLGWPVLADPRSGLRTPAPRTVAAADALLRIPAVLAAARPDLVVRLGQPWASKVLNQWLDGLDAHQVLVDPHGTWADPGRRTAMVSGADPTLLARAVTAAAGPGTPDLAWRSQWEGWETAAQATIGAVLGRAVASEPALARRLLADLPADGTLVCSSSMPVRNVEWWGAPRDGGVVLANRGANGIDGVVSTAIGVAIATGTPTVALLGDLAALYDLGALVWAAERPVHLTLVVSDNAGGGIFSFLPQATALGRDTFERYWGTPPGTDLLALARAYGVTAERVGDPAEVAAFAAGGPGVRVAVVPTDREADLALHVELHRAVAAAVTPSPA